MEEESFLTILHAYMSEEVCPEAYVEWAGLAAISAAVQRKVWVKYGATGRPIFPNIYALLVGPAAVGKSTAINRCGLQFISSLPRMRLAAASSSKEQLYDDFAKAKDGLIEMDIPALGLPYEHASVGLFHTEFHIFCDKTEAKLHSALCDLYDCNATFEHRIKTGKSSFARNVYFTIIGATTTKGLGSIFPPSAAETGLLRRFCIVFADQQRVNEGPPAFGGINEKPKLNANLEKILQRKIEIIHKTRGEFKVSPEAYEVFHTWLQSANKSQPPVPELLSWWAAKDLQLIKIIMLKALSNHPKSFVITAKDVEEAIGVLHTMLALMPRALAYISGSDNYAAMATIYDTIVRLYEMKRTPIPDMAIRRIAAQQVNVRDIDVMLTQMQAMGWIKIEMRGLAYVVTPLNRLALE